MKEVIKTESAPAALGPYSQALKLDKLVFTSGQLGIDPKTQTLPESLADQTRNAIMNLRAILEASGSNLACVLKTTVFLQNMEDFAEVNGIYAELFPAPCPARSCVAVKTLPKNAKIEIEAIAYLA